MAYGTDEGFTAWMALNGHALPAGAPSVAVLRQRGSDYIDALYGYRFRGVPTAGVAQDRAWPRTGATVFKQPIPDDLIPNAVINASYAAVWYEANNPGKLIVVTTPGGQIKRRKVDVIEVEYFEGGAEGSMNATPVLSVVEGMLAPFLLPENTGTGPAIWAIGTPQ